MATKLDAVKNLADRYRGVTRDQDRDTEKDIEKRQAAASLAQSYREKAAAKKMAEEKEERDRLSFNARLADRIRTPARYENVARLTPIEEQTDEEIEAKIGSLRKELEKTRSGSLVSRTKESLGALLGFGKDGEEKKQAWEETQDALYTYEAEKQRRTDEKLLAIAETMSDEEIEARLDELDATTPGVIWDAMAKLGLATGKGERAEKKNESSLLSNYLYERKRERALDSYTLPYSSDADAEQYIKAGMEIEAPKGGLPDWDDRRLYAALTGEIVTAFGLTGAGTGGSAEDKALQYLTDEERNIVAYYVGRGQKDRALGYLDAITDDLMDRQAEDAYETAESFAADHPVIGSAARIASGVGRVGGVIGTAGQWFKNEITGEHEPLDASSPWFAANRTSQALESGVLSNIDSELGRFLAQTGFSIADNVTNRLLFGNTFALTAMGMQAAGDGAYAAAEAGASPEEALVLGIAAGGIEYLTEKIPFDHLTDMLKSAGSSGIKQTLKEVAKQMGSEALEEATSEYANLIVDAVVRGDESEYNQYIAQLVANGMDFSDAEREAVLQYYVENPLLAAAGGALSGGVMGGGASVISHAAESSLGRVDIDDRDRVSLTLQSLGETAKRAGALYDSVYQVVSGKGNEADREAVASSDAARTFVAEQQRARSRRAERAKKSAERAERKLSRSTSRTEGTRLAEGTSSEADARSDSAYGEHGARLRETYGERLTEPAYAEAFSRFYEAGRAGISFEKADAIDPASTVPKQERYRMFAAGQNDVPVSDTGLRGDTFDGWSAEEITTVNKLAHALGVQVVGVESVRAAGADGTYRAARARLVGNTIEVARNATSRETVMQVLGHEFTHRLKQLSADDYARLEAFALSHSQTADEVRARYASLNLSEQDMAEEITAAYAEMLFSDEQTVQRMANEDRGLARRILDFIKDIIGRIRGKVPSELTQAERLWRNALHSAEGRVQRLSRNAGKESGAATKNTAGKDGGKFSIETIPGTNNQYVQADRPVMKGDDPRQWAKYVENYLAEKVLEGEELYIRSAEGDMLTINQTTAWKMGDRAKRNRKGEVVEFLGVSDYDAKTNAALHIDEIVKVSKFSRRAADYNSRHDADHFSYRTAYFMDYDGKYYKLEVSVKEHMGDKTVYNIGNIEKRSSPLNGSSQINGRSGTSRDNADALRRTSTADTISQNEDNVNSQSIQDGVKYSLAYTTENEPVVVIEEDILAGVSKSNYAKVVRQAMRKFDRGIPVGGRLIKVNAITRNEFTRSRNTQFYKGDNEVIYRDKMKAGGYLDEIVLASTNYINEGLNHARKDSFKEFARGNVYMKIGENSYSAKVIIGFTGNEMVLYDIVDIQPANFNTKKDSTKANSQKGDTFEQVESLLETSVSTGASVNTVSQSVRNDRQNAPSNDTISQNEDNVNSHDMQNGVKYSLVGTTKEGIEVYETSENVKALSYSERKKLFRQQMEEEYRGRTAKFERNGHVYYAAFEKADIQKNIYGDRRSDRSGWRAKIDVGADGDIFELVENAVYNGSKKEIGKAIPSHQNIDYWDYFIKTVKIDGTLFDVVANVRKGNGDAYVYSIQINEHKKTKASPLIEETSSSLNRVPNASVNTISQSEDNVNTHDMQISEKYSLNAMDKTEALLEQYGALPEGEREGSAAGREVKVPRQTAKDNRTRRTVRTVMEAAVTSDEIAGDLKEKIEAGEFSYLPTSNKTLLDNAETLVKEKGFDAVLSEWRAHVESTREANDRMLGVGEYLLIHALKTKDANLAGTLAVELSVEATASGRSVSAVRMIKRLGPAAKVYEVMRTVEKLSETTIERRGSRKAVEELSEKRDALMAAYLGHEDAMLDARHEAEILEFLRDNLKASEKSEAKIAELEKEIEYLRGLLEKSKNPAKRRELGERLERANGDLEKARELAKKQRQSREDAVDDLAAIQERIRKAEQKTEQDMRRTEKLIEKLRRGGAQTEPAGTAAQEMTAEVSAALAEARERLRAVTAEAGNMHAKYSRILEVDKELHKLGKYTVDSALLDAFANAKTVKEAEAAGNNILIHVASQVPATFADKWNAWRYLSMLGNVRTHVRNMLGNAVFVPAVRMKNLIGAALEAGGQKGGVRTKDILHSVLGWHDAYRAFAKADFKEMQDIIKSGGKYNPASKIEENRTIYTSKMLRGLEKLRKGNSYLLDLEDTMALRLHYSDSLAGYLAANKVNLKTIDDATLDRARAYAMEEAWKATFRDASKTASLLNRLSKTNAFTKIFVEGLVPFKKTPINILKRGVEYSPAGLIRTLTKGLYDVKKGNITAAQFIDGISSGLTGTALVALGYFLAAAGIIEPGIGDDEKDKFAELQGKQGYALVIGDMSYTIDWLAPAAIPLFVGTSMHTLFHETGEDSPEVMDVLYDVVEPVFEMSMLQGIENALSAVKYGGDGYAVGNILFEGMTGYFGQAVPTVLGQVARTADGTRRTTYTESGAPLASGSRFLQSVMNKTPGLSMLNEPYVDEWGREETTENLAWRIFNTFVSPGYVSTYETSPMEEELKRLHDSTGEDVFPRTAPKYFSADGVRVSMNAKEHTAYQKTMGQTAYHTLTELTGLASYKKAEDALRIKAIDKAYDYAAEMAKKAVLGKDYTPSALVENIEDVTAAGVRVSEYLMFMTAVSEMKSVYGKDGKTVILSKQDQVEEYLRGLSLRAAQKKALWGTLYDSESPWG